MRMSLLLILLVILAAFFSIFLLIRKGCNKLAGNLRWRAVRWPILAIPWLYLIYPVWDWAPRALFHSYHCRTQAYIRIYQTEQEWLAANADRLDQLYTPPFGGPLKTSGRVGQWKWGLVNLSVMYLLRTEPVGPGIMDARRHEEYFYDLSGKRLISAKVNYSVGRNFFVRGGWPQYYAESCFTLAEHGSTRFHGLFKQKQAYRVPG